MANFTQGDCDAIKEFTREKDENGNWFVRVWDANNEYYEFSDIVSAANASKATSETNIHAYLIANCEVKTAPASQRTAPEQL